MSSTNLAAASIQIELPDYDPMQLTELLSPIRPARSIVDNNDDSLVVPCEDELEKEGKNKVDPNRVTWDGVLDPCNPQNWSRPYKWFITGIILLLVLNVTIASSAPTSAIFAIQSQFHTNTEVSYLLISVFVLGYILGSIIWAPGSEYFGRQPIFVVTLSVYTLLYIGQARAPSFLIFIISRFLAGVFSVAPLTNAGGVIADLWSKADIGKATALYTAVAYVGPVAGPILSAYTVSSKLSWRWVFWIMMIFSVFCTTVASFFVPETFAPILLLYKARKIRRSDPLRSLVYADHERMDRSLKGILEQTVLRPFQMFFQERILCLITIYTSLVYGLLFCLFAAFPVIYMERRHFTLMQNGLMFIFVGAGTTLGAVISHHFDNEYLKLAKSKGKKGAPPEERLYGAMLGSVLLVLSTFSLGWTGEYKCVPWFIPGFCTMVLGMSISLIFTSFLTYLIDTYHIYSASAFAVNTFIRAIVASAFPVFTVPMFTKFRINWACTLLGGISLLLSSSPFYFYKKGKQIRAKSKYSRRLPVNPDLISAETKADEAV